MRSLKLALLHAGFSHLLKNCKPILDKQLFPWCVCLHAIFRFHWLPGEGGAQSLVLPHQCSRTSAAPSSSKPLSSPPLLACLQGHLQPRDLVGFSRPRPGKPSATRASSAAHIPQTGQTSWAADQSQVGHQLLGHLGGEDRASDGGPAVPSRRAISAAKETQDRSTPGFRAGQGRAGVGEEKVPLQGLSCCCAVGTREGSPHSTVPPHHSAAPGRKGGL